MPKILFIGVNEEPRIKDIPSGLKPLQAEVGGYIEVVTLEQNVSLICNEEGRLKGLPINRFVDDISQYVHGNFLISRTNAEGQAVDVTPADVLQYSRQFSIKPQKGQKRARA